MAGARLASALLVPYLLAILLLLVSQNTVHMEWFYDHVRIESMIFGGAPQPREGTLAPTGTPGLGLSLKREEAEQFRIH